MESVTIIVLAIAAACVGGAVLVFRLLRKRRFLAKSMNHDSGDRPSADIKRSLFLKWRSPRRGTENPQDMTNEVWKWIIESKLSAYWVNDAFRGPDSMDAGPCWCFSRFGQSETALPDGRVVYVGGEHEDFYDPDFYIYNDVTIIEPSGNVKILGYPTEMFPPTDSHSATLIGNNLILIGNLGYPEDRRPRQTQVLRLEIDSWRMTPIETFEESPGWIHKHTAELSSDGREIRITGGKIDPGEDTPFIENIDEWSLDPETWHWKRLTRRRWPRFVLQRKDQKWNHLSKIRGLPFWKQTAERDKKYEKEYNAIKAELKKELGAVPEQELLESLYQPDVATEIIANDDPDDDEYGVYRIRVDGVVVRYVEDMYSIRITVEGELPEEIVERLRKDITDKFAALERAPVTCQIVPIE